MVIMSELKETVAKNVGVTVDTLNARIEEVLLENKGAWINAGKSEDDCTVLAIRVAGRQLKAEAQRYHESTSTKNKIGCISIVSIIPIILLYHICIASSHTYTKLTTLNWCPNT